MVLARRTSGRRHPGRRGAGQRTSGAACPGAETPLAQGAASGPHASRTSVSRASGTTSCEGGYELSDLGHVLILAGGLSPEREVSLRSGARLRDALREAGVDADTADADAGLIPAVIADPPSAVFPAIHGASGE